MIILTWVTANLVISDSDTFIQYDSSCIWMFCSYAKLNQVKEETILNQRNNTSVFILWYNKYGKFQSAAFTISTLIVGWQLQSPIKSCEFNHALGLLGQYLQIMGNQRKTKDRMWHLFAFIVMFYYYFLLFLARYKCSCYKDNQCFALPVESRACTCSWPLLHTIQ